MLDNIRKSKGGESFHGIYSSVLCSAKCIYGAKNWKRKKKRKFCVV